MTKSNRKFRGYRGDGWLWCLNAKACSTSIKTVITGLPANLVHTHFRTSLFDPEEFKDCFSFGVVRHPWTRLVSAWASKAKRDVLRDDLRNMGCTPYMPFDEFVRVVYETKPWKLDVHVKPQVMPECFIARFENIEHDWLTIMEKTGLGPLPRHGTSEHDDPYSYMTQELADMVNVMYTADFERFGYELCGQ